MEKLNCFKAYDIRGKVPDDLDEAISYKIAHAFCNITKPKFVVLGYDPRSESEILFKSFANGLKDYGVNIVNIGLCGTEEIYFYSFKNSCPGVMITASHNPLGHGGIKMIKKNAEPFISEEIKQIHDDVLIDNIKINSKPGKQINDNIKLDYTSHLLKLINIKKLKPLKILVNPGNSAAGMIIELLEKSLPFDFIYINKDSSGNFPNGAPNPMLPKNRLSTARAVIKHNADIGIAWDGDFDRCFIFDSNGKLIENYYIIGLIARHILTKHQNERIVHDTRLIWNSIEMINNSGGIPIQSKSGHNLMKDSMRRNNAIYGGEISGHHYFWDFGYCDSGMLPWLFITEMLSNKDLYELSKESISRYKSIPETNYRVHDADSIILKLKRYFSDAKLDDMDGMSFEFTEWRFNIRKSNTESDLIRLNIESKKDISLIQKYLKKIEYIIFNNQIT